MISIRGLHSSIHVASPLGWLLGRFLPREAGVTSLGTMRGKRGIYYLLICLTLCGRFAAVSSQDEIASELDIDRLSSVVNDLLDSTDDLDPSSILQGFVRHPLPIANFTIPISDGRIECYDLMLHGLNSVLIREAIANISGQYFSFSLEVPLAQLRGTQKTAIQVSIVALDSHGKLELNVSDVVIFGNASLKNTQSGLQVNSVHAKLEVGDVSVALEGFSDLTQGLLSFAGKEIFDYTKQSMLNDFTNAMTRYANEELLKKIPANLIKFEEDKRLIDSIVQRTTKALVEKGHDPQELRPYRSRIDKLFVQGEVHVENASLAGLSTFRRTGDVLMLYSNRTLLLEASFGFGNLTTKFEWSAKLLGVGPKGTAQLIVTDTEMKIRIMLPLRRGAQVHVENIDVMRIGHIVTHIHGLGTGDAVSEIIINLVSNIFKYDLANFVIETAKERIQDDMNTIDLWTVSKRIAA